TILYFRRLCVGKHCAFDRADYNFPTFTGERRLMRNPIALTGTMLMFVASMAAGQETTADELRGELLYSTHCIACHTTQAHWRNDRLATDWTSLKFQVKRWQANIALGWSEDDVTAVASYLNGLFYHFPATGTKKSSEADATHSIAAQRQD
ncbi:MAG TPA: hypothetical protein VMP00_15700, partial [Burkholderiales bacterium]|nr:hypothetical protein [Burkholderiales bacterium]